MIQVKTIDGKIATFNVAAGSSTLDMSAKTPGGKTTDQAQVTGIDTSHPSSPAVVATTADQNRTTTGMSALTGLSVALAAGVTYKVLIDLYFSPTATNFDGLRFDFDNGGSSPGVTDFRLSMNGFADVYLG